MFKAPGIHSLCRFYPITFVKAKIDFLAVHCHMVPWGVYSIGPVAVKESGNWTVKMTVYFKPDLTFILILKRSSDYVKQTLQFSAYDRQLFVCSKITGFGYFLRVNQWRNRFYFCIFSKCLTFISNFPEHKLDLITGKLIYHEFFFKIGSFWRMSFPVHTV